MTMTTKRAHDLLCPYYETEFPRDYPEGCRCAFIGMVRDNERARAGRSDLQKDADWLTARFEKERDTLKPPRWGMPQPPSLYPGTLNYWLEDVWRSAWNDAIRIVEEEG